MQIKLRLNPVMDDDLISLYYLLGNTGFSKVLRSVYLAYCTGLPFYEDYDVSSVDTEDLDPPIIKITLSEKKYGKLLSEYSLCADKKKMAFLKAVARMYLTPSLKSFYQGSNTNSSALQPLEKTEKPKKEKTQRATKKKETTNKKSQPDNNKVVDNKVPEEDNARPEANQAQTPQFDMQAMMQMMMQMSQQMGQQMPPMTTGAAQTPASPPKPDPDPVLEAEPEEETTEIPLDNSLAGLFGAIGAD